YQSTAMILQSTPRSLPLRLCHYNSTYTHPCQIDRCLPENSEAPYGLRTSSWHTPEKLFHTAPDRLRFPQSPYARCCPVRAWRVPDRHPSPPDTDPIP